MIVIFLRKSIRSGCAFDQNERVGPEYLGSCGREVRAVAASWQHIPVRAHVLRTQHGGQQTTVEVEPNML